MELKMGHDRRLDVDRRMVGDRRFGNNHSRYNCPEKRSTLDRRGYNERRQEKYLNSNTDLFRIAS